MTVRRYQELLGCAVEPCRFRVLRDDDVHGWLGASPDGLIASLTTQGAPHLHRLSDHLYMVTIALQWQSPFAGGAIGARLPKVALWVCSVCTIGVMSDCYVSCRSARG